MSVCGPSDGDDAVRKYSVNGHAGESGDSLNGVDGVDGNDSSSFDGVAGEYSVAGEYVAICGLPARDGPVCGKSVKGELERGESKYSEAVYEEPARGGCSLNGVDDNDRCCSNGVSD